MRRNGMALTALLLASLPAFAQPPRTPPAAPPAAPTAAANATLDRYLQRWEEEMRKVQTLAAQINRLDRDKSFETTTRFSGYAQYMKVPTPGGGAPLNLAMLELRLDGKELAEKFVCTGTYLYHFVPAQKEVRAYEMPKPKPGQVADDSIMSFLFGMKASEARRRYELKLFKEDTWYIYVDITPRSPEDRRDFQRARVVLNKGTFMPRQLWFEHPNGNEVTWDIPTIRSGVELKRATFDKPEVPPGWKLVPVSRTAPERGTPPPAPPRVIRPNR